VLVIASRRWKLPWFPWGILIARGFSLQSPKLPGADATEYIDGNSRGSTKAGAKNPRGGNGASVDWVRPSRQNPIAAVTWIEPKRVQTATGNDLPCGTRRNAGTGFRLATKVPEPGE